MRVYVRVVRRRRKEWLSKAEVKEMVFVWGTVENCDTSILNIKFVQKQSILKLLNNITSLIHNGIECNMWVSKPKAKTSNYKGIFFDSLPFPLPRPLDSISLLSTYYLVETFGQYIHIKCMCILNVNCGTLFLIFANESA